MLKNRRTNKDPIPEKPVVGMIYGPPDAGKTTLACTAGKVLFLDFEHGIGRSDLVGIVEDRVDVERWSDIAAIEESDLEGISCVVFDTAGAAVDKLAADVTTRPKMTNPDGSISLKGYGAIKDAFEALVRRIRGFGVHVLFICHSVENKTATDESEIRPDILGGSIKVVTRLCDFIGFASSRDGKHSLSFVSSAWWAKGPREWGTMQVPNLKQAANHRYVADLIESFQKIEQDRMSAAMEAQNAINDWTMSWQSISDPEQFNEALASIAKQPKEIQSALKSELWGWAKQCGLTYDREEGVFTKPVEEEESS